MKTILLTGSTGFVGQNLMPYFQEKNVGDVIPLNIRKGIPQVLPTADALIHLAGKAHDLKGAKDQQAYFDINYGLTKVLFDRFLESTVNDFIYFSSVKAVADTVPAILTEKAFPNPMTPYGQSKLEAEVYLLSKKLPKGKRLFILRPCMIHGPGNKGNLNLLYKLIKKGIPYPLGVFKNHRSFLSIANLLFVLERIVKDAAIHGGIYNVADDEALSTNEVIEIIGVAIRRKAHIWTVSPNIINAIAKLGDILHLPLNSERLKKLTESYIVCNDKIKKELDIMEMPVSSRAGLISTVKSFD